MNVHTYIYYNCSHGYIATVLAVVYTHISIKFIHASEKWLAIYYRVSGDLGLELTISGMVKVHTYTDTCHTISLLWYYLYSCYCTQSD